MSTLRNDLYLAWSRAIALILLLTGAGWVNALPDDRDQPIHITADQALRDEKKGMTVYSGNVHMSQGSLRISADKITIFHSTEELDRVIAEGSPATLQQQPDPDKGPVFFHFFYFFFYFFCFFFLIYLLLLHIILFLL